ncbi:hypothetical protein D9V41_10760 [Aeromicrobium phragmitis]|uniref:Uncharacterized protein n=2 Tax=Aeromicrobium phragmitis TaxID=2478914 RepID=A0A3L8PJU0_9ACTN|nr:hypothetical protein D9V41_10760 [Aeromicrobium phragmitis]
MWLVGRQARALVDGSTAAPGDHREQLMTLDRALASPLRLAVGGVALVVAGLASLVVGLAAITIVDGRMDVASWLLLGVALVVYAGAMAALIVLGRSGSRLVDAWLRWFGAHREPVGRRGIWGRFFTLGSWVRAVATALVLLAALMAAGLVVAGASPGNPAGFDGDGRVFSVALGLAWGIPLLATTVTFARGDFRTMAAIGRRVRDEYARR